MSHEQAHRAVDQRAVATAAASSRTALDRPAPAASVWVSAGAALVVSVVLAWVTSVIGGPLARECARSAGAGSGSCAEQGRWLDTAIALDSTLALLAVALLVLTALRRTRFVRRTSLVVLVVAVACFFGAVLMAAGGL